jgi:hypothetical protein
VGICADHACRTGEEIQSLSRFIGAQRLAFTKLLKKYKKWTGSNTLDPRFKSEVLNSPTSFTKISLSNEFEDWTDILQAIRAAFNPDISRNVSPRGSMASPTRHPIGSTRPRERSEVVANRLGTAIASASDVAFDATFADAPIGETGARAVYWIHPEQLIEVQVLLLQHLRLYLTKPTFGSSSSHSQSPAITRKSSLSRSEGQVEKEVNDYGVVIMDQAEDFARRQSRSTVSDSEDSSGKSFAKPTAIARWTVADEAIVSLRQFGQSGKTGAAKVKKKHLGALLNVDRDFKPWKNPDQLSPVDGQPFTFSDERLSPEETRNLLKEQHEVKPLVGIFAKRTRFLGLSNSPSMGQWCVLDSQISISKISQNDLVGTDWAANLARDAKNFPYAVLKVREEGEIANSIIDILDKSHLVCHGLFNWSEPN